MDLETAKKEFGLRVKSYRNSRNLTQEQFCSLTDLEQANLSNIENGKTYPGFMTICTMIETVSYTHLTLPTNSRV